MTRPVTSLRIAQPCAQSWAAMAPTGPGRHCAACQKTVVDFTLKTDAEILAYLAGAATKTCGRFRAGQVGRPLRPAPPTPKPVYWQAWLAGLLVAALATQSCQPTTLGEPQPRLLAPAALGADSTGVAFDSVVAEHIPASLARPIEGQVYAVASQLPASRVTVQLAGNEAFAVTDATGHFIIQLPEAVPTPVRIVLRLTAVGYAPQLVAADSEQRPAQGLAIAHLSYPVPEMTLGDVEMLVNEAH